MKNNRNNYLAALAATALAIPAVKAATTVDGSNGVDMGLTTEGYIYNYLPIELGGGTWLDGGLASLVAPVGQFTGFDDAGNPLIPTDLIPLRTTSVTIIDPDTGDIAFIIDKDFQGPAGPAGATGATGAQGPQGPAGPAGAAGAKGDKGDQGNPGATGAQGPAGPAGATGAKGDKGDKGDQGNPGATGATGAQGPVGPAGATGAKGDKGDQGNPGATGAQGPAGPAGTPATASNGLTKVGDDIRLGGSLTAATTIQMGGNAMSFMNGPMIFRPSGITNQFHIDSGHLGTNTRLFSTGDIEIQANTNPYQLYLKSNGRIGIGTNTPLAPLHVASITEGAVNRSGPGKYFNYGSTGFSDTPYTSGSISASIIAEGRIVTKHDLVAQTWVLAQQTITFSDSRIKDIAGISASSADLETLKKIEVTDYTMKDKASFGDRKYKKVIAQQVEEVFPQAVNKSVNFIPNVLSIAEVSLENEKLTVTLPKEADLKAGDLVRFITKAGQEEEVKLDMVDGKRLGVTLSHVKAGDQVFVYGKQVDDFRAVDYDALSMLNISATQELARKVEVLTAENAQLKQLAGEVSQLKALVAALEGKASGNVTVSLK